MAWYLSDYRGSSVTDIELSLFFTALDQIRSDLQIAN